ncbi:hypothetical protein IQ260_07785 [Leptolyngbya cf. ectocarpi LEGE 11479]|uniref:Uncharacterized protein n=1 Tax=Leptolyngbya cf. ectocarpi LEGE 11479 TaxID=1828722 RepID=A0A928ZQS4_LEPEC|nr:hypothetical protein [Leptolyngbya ectocarpi]MBE9066550.1 hypothetical protein [Leptolyngbya cf. ectocarpi LEGE 11479]
MGEAKRRQKTDPNYGKVPQKPPKTRRRFKFDPKRITPTEMLIWAVLFGGTAAVFLSTYFWQS